MRIDSHQHFWAVARGDYGWLTPELKPLYKDFAPQDLQPLLKTQNIDGTILVQAAPTLAETHYMLELADANDFIKGVVGWVDFESPDAPDTIAELAAMPKLVGLRPMIHDIENDDWMLGEQLSPAFNAVIKNNLVFDALTFPRHLSRLQQLIERYPELKVVIDHGSKPDIETGLFDDWAEQMADIAASFSASVKLSGLVTEAGDDWSVQTLKPYVDHLLTVFGPQRVIWGSDWPVCIPAASYERWCEATDELLLELTATDKALVLGGNASRVYGLQ